MPTRYYTAGEDRLIARWMNRGVDWLSRLCGMLRRGEGSIKERVLVLKGRRQDAATDDEDDETIDRRDELTIAVYRAASNDEPRTTERIAKIVGCTAAVAQAELEYLKAGKMVRRTADGEWHARVGFMADRHEEPMGNAYIWMMTMSAKKIRRRQRPTSLDQTHL